MLGSFGSGTELLCKGPAKLETDKTQKNELNTHTIKLLEAFD